MTTFSFRREWLAPRELVRTSTGTVDGAEIVVVELTCDGVRGRGEAHGIDYRGDTPDRVMEQLEAVRRSVEAGIDRTSLRSLLPAGGARNALDAALWDLQAKSTRTPVARLAGMPPFTGGTTLVTLALSDPQAMAAQARRWQPHDRFKLKLGAGDGRDLDRVRSVRAAVPDATLIADANCAWSFGEFSEMLGVLEEARVALIEEPIALGERDRLLDYRGTIPLCADESFQSSADWPSLLPCYALVNIKLDKCGGLSDGLRIVREASDRGLKVVIGGTFATSLGVAPATVLAPMAAFIDFDAPLFFGPDRDVAIPYTGGRLGPVPRDLWGW